MEHGAPAGCARHQRRDSAGWFLGVAWACLPVLVVLMALAMGGCTSEIRTTTSPPGSPTSSSRSGEAIPPPSTHPQQPEETTTTSAVPDVVKVGALFPLTGGLATEGESALKGMRLAIEEVNTAGGIASLAGALLALVEADSKGDPSSADAEVARLVKEQGVAAIVGTAQSTVALRATDAAERLELPFLVSAGAADEVTERNLDYTFRLCPKADWYARDQVAFLLALPGLGGPRITSVALLHENGEFGRRTAASQRRHLEQAGIEVVEQIEYSPDRADVHSEMFRIKQSGAQAILTATLLADAALIAESAAVLRVNVPIIDAAGGVLDPRFVADAGEASESVFSVAESAAGMARSRALEQKLPVTETALDRGLLYGYQAVWVLASALERAGSTEGPRLRSALNTTALYGERLVLPQELLMFDGDGQNRGARLVVVQVQDGRMVTVWPREYAGGTVRLP